MSGRAALPGLVTGFLGLAAGLLAAFMGEQIFGAVAGVLALAAGVAGVRLAQRLDEQAALQKLVEGELRTVRSEAAEAREQLRRDIEVEYEVAEIDAGDDTLTDVQTGLFSEGFFHVALDSRLAAARRHLRPVAVVLLEVVTGLPGDQVQDADAHIVATSITETLREADTACRLRNGYFALLLEDTPENGAIWTVERIRRAMTEQSTGTTMWAGIACYPAHAFSSEEIMTAADQALSSAREWRQDRIEVAAVMGD